MGNRKAGSKNVPAVSDNIVDQESEINLLTLKLFG